MADNLLNGLDPKDRLDDEALDTVAGGYTEEELAQMAKVAMENTSYELDYSSDKPWTNGMGRKKGGSMSSIKK